MFRPSKRPSLCNSKDPNREDTQMTCIYYWRDVVLTVYNKYIFSQYSLILYLLYIVYYTHGNAEARDLSNA